MPRTHDTLAQRAQLSEAVWLVLAERGPGGLTLRAVAEAASCTTGLVLHTFRDKQALLLHARDLLHVRTRDRADEIERTTPHPPAALAGIVLDAIPTTADRMANARIWVGFLAASLGDPVLARRHSAHSHALIDRLARLISAIGDISDEESGRRANALAAALEGVSTLAVGDPTWWTTEKQRAAVTLTLEAAVMAPPPPGQFSTL